MNRPTPRIIHIIPAGGWRWRTSDAPATRAYPLTCWAIVERDHGDGELERTVEGVDVRCDDLYGLVEEWAAECREQGRDWSVGYEPPDDGRYEDRASEPPQFDPDGPWGDAV